MSEKLREYRMKFELVLSDEQAVDTNKLGLRSKLGGEPDWDQADETPICLRCEEAMAFVAQIDSIEHDEDHNPHRIDCLSNDQQYLFGDVGMIYVFVCFRCFETQSVMQFG